MLSIDLISFGKNLRPSAVDALNKINEIANALNGQVETRLAALEAKFSNDIDWTLLPLSSDFQNYNVGQNELKYKRTGNVVNISGQIKPTAELDNSTHVIATLPTSISPSTSHSVICNGSSKNTFMLSASSGELKLARYGTTTAGTVPTNAFLVVEITYVL